MTAPTEETTHVITTKQTTQTITTHMPSAKELEAPTLLTPRQEQIIHHLGYTVSYNKQTKLPNWVAYELTRVETQGNEKRNNRFIADPLVKGIIATNADYNHSGYDKGHMAPAADMKWSPEAMKESFYFSNMCPQRPGLNRKGWKVLEEKVRDWAIADSAVVIICGPILEKSPKTIGRNQVVVPKKFFKVILSPFAKPIRAIGFLFDNDEATAPLRSYAVTVDSVEHLTGMDFFAPLPDNIERTVEGKCNYNLWPN
jgi:endonuclease G